jgi:hypothetical protein
MTNHFKNFGDHMSANNINNLKDKHQGHLDKEKIKRFIQLALVGSVLTTLYRQCCFARPRPW